MKRPFLLFLVLMLAVPVAAAAAPAGFPRKVTDASGAVCTVPRPPRRIISLAPGTTEMLFALGLGSRVVGDTTFCNYPPAARRVPKIGNSVVNYERVIALRPDLIVCSDASRSAATRLREMRQPVLNIAPTTFAAVEQSLRLIGAATGSERQAQAVVAAMERKARLAAAIAAHDPSHRPRVLIVIGTDPLWAAGPGTFMNDLVLRAGGTNAAATSAPYAPYSREAVLAHPPDAVLAAPGDAAGIRADSVLSRLPAVRGGRLILIDGDMLTRPGPRLADALLALARALHPGVK